MPDPLQRALALGAAVLSLPLVVVLAALIMLDSRGRPFYLAGRLGVGGQPFRIYKLRTMRQDAASSGPAISTRIDCRVTRLGGFLRRTRLDELPQLWNVVRGEMRLVGPRPEDPRFVDFRDPLHRLVFRAKPGITGPTQLAFAAESELLGSADPEEDYRTRILPAKVALDARYLHARSIGLDLWVLRQTVLTAAGRPPSRQAIDARLAVLDRAKTSRPV
jgi:lipopolysaccharide/colanic/teichoic acid biosynthesis glycosyltransferase